MRTTIYAIASLVLVLQAIPSNAQKFKYDWSFLIPGDCNHNDKRPVVVDNVGNVYVTGGYQFVQDMDPGPGVVNLTPVGLTDVFINKYDSLGNLIWARSFGGNVHDYGRTLAIDQAGNILISGTFRGEIDFDPGPGVHLLGNPGFPSNDAFVVKLDPNGNFIWARVFGYPSGLESSSGIATDGAGSVYFLGIFQDSIDLDPGPAVSKRIASPSTSAYDVFLVKLDASGSFQWGNTWGNSQMVRGRNVTIDQTGAPYLTGFFEGTLDFDPGSASEQRTAVGGTDAYVLSLSPSGAYQWVNTIGSTLDEWGRSIAIASDGTIYSVGHFRGTASVTDGAGQIQMSLSSPSVATYLQKHSPSGQLIWAKRTATITAGSSTNTGRELFLDSSGDVYIGGYFSGTHDFDPGPGTVLASATGFPGDHFIQRLDSAGNFRSISAIEGAGSVTTYDLDVSPTGSAYIHGWIDNTTDFDPGPGTSQLTNTASRELFVTKWLPCQTFDTIVYDTACGPYLAPDGNTYRLSNSFTFTFTDVVGCDSIVHLELFSRNTTDTVVVKACQPYVAPNGNTYATSGTYTITVPNAAGCDSLITIHLSVSNLQVATNVLSSPICLGDSTGSASVAVWGGLGNLNYQWSTGDTGVLVSTFPVGKHVVTVSDTNGCSIVDSVQMQATSALSLFFQTTATTCSGDADGSAQVTVTVGLQPFTYLWSTGDTTGAIGGLDTGMYVVTVTDQQGCMVTDSVLVGFVDPTPVVQLGNDTVVGFPTLVTLSSGHPNLTNQWSTGATTSTIQVEVITDTIIWVEVTSLAGCVGTDTIRLQGALGHAERLGSPEVKVYPNPTSNKVYIEAEDPVKGDLMVSVIDITGRVVLTKTFADYHAHERIEVDQSAYGKGNYWLRLETEEFRAVKPITVY